MTDRIKGVTVAFTQDIRADDVQYIVNAIKMIKGVEDVGLSVHSSDDYIIETRVTSKIVDKIYQLVKDVREGV